MAFQRVVVHYLAAGKERRIVLEHDGGIRGVLFDLPPQSVLQKGPPDGVEVLDRNGNKIPASVVMTEPGPVVCYLDPSGAHHCW